MFIQIAVNQLLNLASPKRYLGNVMFTPERVVPSELEDPCMLYTGNHEGPKENSKYSKNLLV